MSVQLRWLTRSLAMLAGLYMAALFAAACAPAAPSSPTAAPAKPAATAAPAPTAASAKPTEPSKPAEAKPAASPAAKAEAKPAASPAAKAEAKPTEAPKPAGKPASGKPQLPPGVTPQGKLQEILQRGSVNIWMNAGFPPYETIEPATGQMAGLDVDLAKMLFEEGLGVRIEFTNSTFQGLIPALAAGQTDFVISAMGATEERAQRVDFSIPYSPAGNVVMVRKDNTAINTLDDLSGKIVGGETGSTPYRRAEVFNEELQAKGRPGYQELRSYNSAPTVWEDVRSGRLDAAAVGFSTAAFLIKERPNDFRIVTRIGGESYFAMVAPKGEQSLLAYVNAKIREWKADGTLLAIHRKWFGDFAPELLNEIPTLPNEVFYSR